VGDALVCLRQGEATYATQLTNASGQAEFRGLAVLDTTDVVLTAVHRDHLNGVSSGQAAIVVVHGTNPNDNVVGTSVAWLDGVNQQVETCQAAPLFPLRTGLCGMNWEGISVDLDLDDRLDVVASDWCNNVYAWELPEGGGCELMTGWPIHFEDTPRLTWGGIDETTSYTDLLIATGDGLIRDVMLPPYEQPGGGWGTYGNDNGNTGFQGCGLGSLRQPPELPSSGITRIFPRSGGTGQVIQLVASGANPVRLAVYDVAGRRVRTLLHGEKATGPLSVVWDTLDEGRRRVPSGIYFYRYVDGPARQVRRTVVLR